MTTWKTVDLTKFNAVPLTELIPDKIYIMYGYRQFWPRSRWVVKFKQLLENGDIAKLDVLNVKFQHFEPSADDLGENKNISTFPFIFYDYDDIFKMKKIVETGMSPPFNPPSLASVAQHQLYTSELSTARHYDQLGLKSRQETGGKKTRNRRKHNKKSKKSNRKGIRKSKVRR